MVACEVSGGAIVEAIAEVEIARSPGVAFRAVRRVLVVDDSRMQRRILSAQLARSGYAVIEAGTAEDALQLCDGDPPDVVISDWMMPGMTGIEFCQQLRTRIRAHYVYFILLTSKTETTEVARGLEGGADDFLIKPVSGDELRARIAAGERILSMERELTDKNRLLSDTLAELRGLYDSIDRDLVEARKLQQSLVRDRHRDFGPAEISLLLRPSGHVGGDFVGFFPTGDHRVGLFSIDVSGHGITSALMTARLAGYLSGSVPTQNLALVQDETGRFTGRDPGDLALALNQTVLGEIRTETYFTLAYADVDLASGRTSLVQAGHPHPLVQRADGSVELLGAGGLPIGLIEGARFESFDVKLNPGDRLFLMSDGITEAEDANGRQLATGGLQQALDRCQGLRGIAFLEALLWQLTEHAGVELADDVSCALLEFHGAAGPRH